MFLFPVTDIDSKTISFTQLWEHANLHNEGTSIFKPEIIEHQGYIYANYGNVLYVFQQSTGKDLFSYIPIIDGDLYLILNIEIYGKALYAFIINNEAIKGSNRYNMKFFFFKLNIENFKIDWIQKCQYAYTRYFFVHNEIYLFNMTLSMTSCFDRYDIETGCYLGSIELLLPEDLILVTMPSSYNQDINQVWLFFFQKASEHNLIASLHIYRFEIESGQFIEPIIIPLDPSFCINLSAFSFYPMLYRKNLLFAEYRILNKYVLIKINIKTKMVDWIYESNDIIQEIIPNPIDKNSLYLREGLNSYRKINLHNKNSLHSWELKDMDANYSSYSASSCFENIIATRFVHYFVVSDVNTGKILWMKQSEKPDRYKDVAEIGFSSPIIKKLDQYKYQILYTLEDQIGLLEINLQN